MSKSIFCWENPGNFSVFHIWNYAVWNVRNKSEGKGHSELQLTSFSLSDCCNNLLVYPVFTPIPLACSQSCQSGPLKFKPDCATLYSKSSSEFNLITINPKFSPRPQSPFWSVLPFSHVSLGLIPTTLPLVFCNPAKLASSPVFTKTLLSRQTIYFKLGKKFNKTLNQRRYMNGK